MHRLIVILLCVILFSCRGDSIEIQVVSMQLVESPQQYVALLDDAYNSTIVGMLRFQVRTNVDLFQRAKTDGLNIWARFFLCSNMNPLSDIGTIFKHPLNKNEYFVFVGFESINNDVFQYEIGDLTGEICILFGMGSMVPFSAIKSNMARYRLTVTELTQLKDYKRSNGVVKVESNQFKF